MKTAKQASQSTCPPAVEIRLSNGRRMRMVWRPRKRLSRLLMRLLSVFVPLFLTNGQIFAGGPAIDTAALPTGGRVTAGQAAISQTSASMTVVQASQRAALNWQTFNIGAAAAVNFDQPNAAAVALNTISGGASEIYGKLTSNGQVFFSNPSGMLFARGAQVNVGGLLATTMSLSNQDFMSGNYQLSGAGSGIIRNEGLLSATGSIALIGNTVQNAGEMYATTVTLAAGNSVAIDLSSDGLIRARVVDPALKASIENSGSIGAASVALTAGQARDTIERVVNNNGIIRASGLALQGGEIVLEGGRVLNSGVLDASSATGKGGTVKMLGNEVGITDNGVIDASGRTGGGTILVGGDAHGGNASVPNATVTYFGPSASLRADATDSGNGGKIIVWANDATRAYGTISARGGAQGGDGGFVEVSGENYLDYQAVTDTRAPQGASGTLLLDPTSNVTISDAGNALFGGTFDVNRIFAGATSAATNIQWTTIDGQLAGGNVIVTTTGSGGAGNIAITDSHAYNSSNALSLLAHGDISANTVAVINGGSGNINLYAGWNGLSTAAPVVSAAKNISLTGSTLQNNTGNISLVAGGNITLSNSYLQVNNGWAGGNEAWGTVTLTAGGAITQSAGGGLKVGTLYATAAGDITLNAALSDNWVNILNATTTGGNVWYDTGYSVKVDSVQAASGDAHITSNFEIYDVNGGGVNVVAKNVTLLSHDSAVIDGWGPLISSDVQLTSATGTLTVTAESGGGKHFGIDVRKSGVNSTGLVTLANNSPVPIGGRGGEASITYSTNDVLSLGANINSANGGDLNLSAAGITLTSNVITQGGALNLTSTTGADISGVGKNITTSGGSVTLNAPGAAVHVGSIDTSVTDRTSGYGGSVSITGWGDVTTSTINTSSVAATVDSIGAGSVTIRSYNGGVTTGNIDTHIYANGGFVSTGPAGDVTIRAANNVQTGWINSSAEIDDGHLALDGVPQNGGAITLTSDWTTVDTGALNSSTLTLDGNSFYSANGGAVRLNAAGNITVSGGIDTSSLGPINDHVGTTFSVGNGGAVNLQSDLGSVTVTGEIFSAAQAVGGGSAAATWSFGSGGDVNIVAVLDVTTANITTVAFNNFLTGIAGRAGAVNIAAGGNVLAGNIDSTTSAPVYTYDNSAVNISAGGSITVGNISTWTSDSFRRGGDVTLTAGTDATTGTIDTEGGDGGSVSITAGGTITAGSIDASGGNYGGNILLDAGNTLQINVANYVETSHGATISLISGGHVEVWGSVNTGDNSTINIRPDSKGACVSSAVSCGDIYFTAGSISTGFNNTVNLYYNPVGSHNGNLDYSMTDDPANGALLSNIIGSGSPLVNLWMLVNDVQQLQAVNTNLSGNYALGRDIGASGTADWDGGAGFMPLGSFGGQFDGLNHSINGLVINRPDDDYVGLFSSIGGSGSVNNLGLLGGSVAGWSYVGGLAGENSGIIANSYNTGTVTGNGDKVGGLAGRNRADNGAGNILNSYSTGAVSGVDRVGGLVGYNTGAISNSYSTGTVSGRDAVGGLVGRNSDTGVLLNVYSTGNVSGSDMVGGLVGENSGSIVNAYATGAVIGNDSVGGLVGSNDSGSNSDDGYIDSAWSSGFVTGNSSVGGLVGYNGGSSWISNAFWDTTTSGKDSALTSGIGQNTGNAWQNVGGYTTTDLMLSNTYDSCGECGWPGFFDNWFMIDGKTRPFLQSEWSTTIGNAHQLQLVSMNTNASYKLSRDIDLSEVRKDSGMWSSAGFVPIDGPEGSAFAGRLDGKGHVVSNLFINRPDDWSVGLFRAVDNGGAVKNLGISSGEVIGYGDVGGLTGLNYGSLSNVWNAASVTGKSHVGGLVGYNTGTVSFAYNTGTVTADNDTGGGLVSWNVGGLIYQSWSSGQVSGGWNVGGFVGFNGDNGSITGRIRQSYYDADSSLNNYGVPAYSSAVIDVGTLGAGNSRIQSSYEGNGWNFGPGGAWVMVGGDGNTRPFLRSEYQTVITNAHQLQLINMDLTASYTLASDVDMSELKRAAGMWNTDARQNSGNTGFVPLGDWSTPFTGSFDGQNHVISGLQIRRPLQDSVGLFGVVDYPADVRNVALEGGSVTGYDYTGALAGENYSTIVNVSSSASVFGHDYVGGLVGYNDGDIWNAFATGDVTGNNTVGGLAGYNDYNISNAWASGAVKGNDSVGGLVGYNDYGDISNSFATGNVIGNNYLGGLVGENNNGYIGNAFASGNVTGIDTVGGLVGRHLGSNIIEYAYATGDVKGNDSVGGLVGTNYGSIDQTWSSGRVTGNSSAGGLVGYNDLAGSVSNSFWDTTINNSLSGVGSGTGANTSIALTTGQFFDKSNFTGFDFTLGSGQWWMVESTFNNGYSRPFLQFEWSSSIVNAHQLQLINMHPDASYTLARDIDMGELRRASGMWSTSPNLTNGNTGFVPVDGPEGAGNFSGRFDGQNHAIIGLQMSRPNDDYVGLFGTIDSSGVVNNVGLLGGSVTGYAYVGGLVGENRGSIANSYNTGTVSGDGDKVGGLAGRNRADYGAGNILNSYSTGAVSGYDRVGGLVGYNTGAISNSYSSGTVSGQDAVGGLVGRNSDTTGVVSNSYSTGNVSGTNMVGGLVGENSGSIINAYATGAVIGNDSVGGLVGSNDSGSNSDDGFIDQTWSSGLVTGNSNVGGLVGYHSGYILNSYWDVTTSGQGSGVGSDEGFTTQVNPLWGSDAFYSGNYSFDFNNTWFMIDGGTRPFLRSEWSSNISNDHQLQMISMNPAVNYTLAKDIDLSAVTNPSGMWRTDNSDSGFVPVGDWGTPFAGRLDGNGHAITNLTQYRNGGDFAGLFGRIGSGGEVNNLSLSGTIVGDNVSEAGGLAGRNEGRIVGVRSSVNVFDGGEGSIGGLAGSNYGTIANSSATGVITGGDIYCCSAVGGLVGYNEGSIRNSHATGSVFGGSGYVGGLVGESYGSIANVYASGDVTGNGYNIGGLAGYNNGSIRNAYASGAVYGDNNVGGLVGYNDGSGTITNAYATGEVNGNDSVGGLVGYNAGSIDQAWSSGLVTGNTNVGGFVGWNNGYINNGYWDYTINWSLSGIGTGIDYTVGLSSWDFTHSWNFGLDFTSTWFNIDGQTRPFLRSEYQTDIGNAHQLQLMSMNPTTSYTLASDVDMGELARASGMWTSSGFVPVGDSGNQFTGRFDGQNHVITGLQINRPFDDNIGLFGYVAIGADLRNVGLDGGSVTGNTNVGGLAGYSGASISNAYATGNVTGNDKVGGLVGLHDSSTITNAYATGNVTGANSVGGLVGQTYYGTITNAYATGNVTGTNSVGGLVGYSTNGTITNAYAMGNVTGIDGEVGGLVGNNQFGIITNAYATGNASSSVTGTGSAGGLVGFNSGTIDQAWSSGLVTGNAKVGGLVGYNTGSITNAYATGDATGNDQVGGLVGLNTGSIDQTWISGLVAGSIIQNVGALVGYNNGSINHSYYDATTSNQFSPVGPGSPTPAGQYVDGLLSPDFFKQAMLPNLDFANTWFMIDGQTRPFLQSEWSTSIGNSHQLQLMSMNPSASYTLVRDVDMSEVKRASGMWVTDPLQNGDNSRGFVPIADGAESGFTGRFDGQNHAITNLFIDRPTWAAVGLFATIGSNADVHNVNLERGSVTGNFNVGALAGENYGTVTNGSSSVSVNGGDNVGGLVGYNDNLIVNGSSTGMVTSGVGHADTGGLVGYNVGTIRNSRATGTVAGDQDVGGLVGYNDGTVDNSWAGGDVSGNYRVGGLAGLNDWNIANAYATGKVTGDDRVGGLVGEHFSNNIDSAWSSGLVTGNTNVGGLVGFNFTGSISNSYWDATTSTQFFAVGSGGSGDTNPLNGWQAFSQSQMGNLDFKNTWFMIDGYTRPFLRSEWSNSITNDHQLQLMSMNPSANYTLANNVDLSQTANPSGSGMWNTDQGNGSTGFVPVGDENTPFTGRLDGNGHLITNLSMYREYEVFAGLFGRIGFGGEVSKLGVSGDISTYSVNEVGGLAGKNEGRISRVYSSVAVIASDGGEGGGVDAGSLVGWNSGIIKDAYATGAVSTVNCSGNCYAGGLAGYNTGTLRNTYATGWVQSGDYVGGLVGSNDGKVINSFYDVQTTGIDYGSSGTGSNTGGMLDPNNFNYLWNYNTTWGQVANVSYPYLQWQFNGAPTIVSGLVGDNGMVGAIGAPLDPTQVAGRTVKLAVDGTSQGSVTTGANGFYYSAMSASTLAGDALLAYLGSDGGRSSGAHVRQLVPGNQLNGTDIRTDSSVTVSVKADYVSSAPGAYGGFIALMDTAKGALGDGDIPYTMGGSGATRTVSLKVGNLNLQPIAAPALWLDSDATAGTPDHGPAGGGEFVLLQSEIGRVTFARRDDGGGGYYYGGTMILGSPSMGSIQVKGDVDFRNSIDEGTGGSVGSVALVSNALGATIGGTGRITATRLTASAPGNIDLVTDISQFAAVSTSALANGHIIVTDTDAGAGFTTLSLVDGNAYHPLALFTSTRGSNSVMTTGAGGVPAKIDINTAKGMSVVQGISTAGGNIKLTGGLTGGVQQHGIDLQSVTIDSGGGSITLTGRAGTTGYGSGVNIIDSTISSQSATTDGGAIVITGYGGDAADLTSWSNGVNIKDSIISSQPGGLGTGGIISITGTGGAYEDAVDGGSWGVAIAGGSTVDAYGGALTLMGTGGAFGSAAHGVALGGNASAVALTSTGGTVQITGIGGGDSIALGTSKGVRAFFDTVTVSGATVIIDGTAGSGGNAIKLGDSGYPGHTIVAATGGVTITGTGGDVVIANDVSAGTTVGVTSTGALAGITNYATITGPTGITLDAGIGAFINVSDVSTGGVLTNGIGAGTISITANSADLQTGGAAGDSNIAANTGNVLIKPKTVARSILVDDVSNPGATLNLTSAELGTITTGSLVTLGTAASTNFTVSSAFDVGALDLLALAGTINIGASGAISAHDITLSASTSFTNANATGGLTANGGGRWLVYSQTPLSDNKGGLVYAFKEYNKAYATAPTPVTGDGFLYTVAPVITAGLTGAITKTYNATTAAAVGAGNYTVSGAIDLDTVTLNNPAAGLYTGTGAGVGNKTVTVNGIAITSAMDGAATVYGYTLASTSASASTFTINPYIVNLSGSRGYNGSANVLAAAMGMGPLVGAETLTLAGTGTMFDKNVGVNKPVALGTLALGDGGGGGLAANYTLLGGTDTETIIAANLTVSTANVVKTYDQTLAAPGAAAIVTAGVLFAPDTLGGVPVFAYTNKDFGAGNKTVTVAGVTVNDGNGGLNYNLTQANNTTSTINKAPLTINGLTAQNKTYDGNTTDIVTGVATISGGVFAGDTVTIGGANIGAFGNKNVGVAKAVTVTIGGAGLVLGGAEGIDYTITQPGLTADIIARALTVGATGINRAYDSTTNATVNLTDDRVAGDVLALTDTAASFLDKNVGNGKTVNVSGIDVTGADSGNYTFNTTTSTTANITKASIAAVTGITANNKNYNATTAATLVTGSAAFTGEFAGDTLTVGAATGNFTDKNAANGKTVNITGIALGGADAGNYTLTSTTASTTANITKAAISTVTGITAQNKVYNANTTATLNSGGAAFTGEFAGDTLTVGAENGAFTDKNVANGKTVNITGIALGGTDAGNYTLTTTTASTTANITRAGLTVTGITANNKVYNANTAATLNTGTASFTGEFAGDTLSLVGVTGAFTDKNVANGKTVNITGISLAGADSGNYTLSSSTGSTTANITRATIAAVTGITGVNKVYNANTVATLNTLSAGFTGEFAGDTLTVGAATGNFTDKNAANGKTVNITGIALGGGDAGNYTLASTTAGTTADITKASLTVSASGVNRVYDATTIASVILGDNHLASDSLILGYSGASFVNKNVGAAKPVGVVGINVTGTDAGNYTLANATASTTANITPASISAVTGITAANKVYNANIAATLNSAGAGFTGEFAGDTLTVAAATGAFTDKNVANGKTVHISGIVLGGADVGNYTLASATASTTANITPASLAVTGLAAQNKVYDATTVATVSGPGVLAGIISGDAVGLSGAASASFADKNVGDAKPVTVASVGLAGIDAGNYVVTPPLGLAANITPKALTTSVIADDKVYDRTTGASISTLVSMSGIFAGDVVAPLFTLGAFDSKNVGVNKPVDYIIGLGGADAGNYTATGVTAASITARPVTLNAVAENKIYDGNKIAGASVTAGNIIAGDAMTLDLSGAAANFNDKNVGAAKPVSVTGIGFTGADLGNYSFSTTAGASADITPRPVTVSAVADNKVYDGTIGASGTLTPSNIIAGDAMTLDFSGVVANFNNKNVGTAKPVGVTGISFTGADLGNYTFNTTASSAADVTARPVTVSAVADNKVYDGNNTAGATYTPSNIIAGDAMNLDVTGVVALFNNKNVGTAKPVGITGISFTGADLGNYTFNTTASSSADVTPRPVTVSAIAENKVYDGTIFASPSVTAGNIIAGDAMTLDLSGVAANFNNKNVGTAKPVGVTGISFTGADLGNYTFNTTATASADITARPVTVSAVAQSREYNGNNQASAALTPSNIIAGDAMNLDVSGVAALFNDKNVGTAKPVSVTGIGFTGADVGNYTFNTTASSAADIWKRELVWYVTDSQFTSGGVPVLGTPYLYVPVLPNNPGMDRRILTDDIKPGDPGVGVFDNLTNLQVASILTLPVGTYAERVIVPLTGADAGNYELKDSYGGVNSIPGTLTVNSSLCLICVVPPPQPAPNPPAPSPALPIPPGIVVIGENRIPVDPIPPGNKGQQLVCR